MILWRMIVAVVIALVQFVVIVRTMAKNPGSLVESPKAQPEKAGRSDAEG